MRQHSPRKDILKGLEEIDSTIHILKHILTNLLASFHIYPFCLQYWLKGSVHQVGPTETLIISLSPINLY